MIGILKEFGSGWVVPPVMPEKEPDRNVEAVTTDAIGQVFVGVCSSYLVGSLCRLVMWREVEGGK